MKTIGACVERITVQTATETEGTDGGESSTSWATLATMPAEFIPKAVIERLLPTSAIGSEIQALFRVRRRVDVTAKMRVSWTPTWPPGATAHTFEIRGIHPVEDGRTWMYLECTKPEFS